MYVKEAKHELNTKMIFHYLQDGKRYYADLEMQTKYLLKGVLWVKFVMGASMLGQTGDGAKNSAREAADFRGY